jgi:hypothetical protein
MSCKYILEGFEPRLFCFGGVRDDYYADPSFTSFLFFWTAEGPMLPQVPREGWAFKIGP